MQISTYAKYQSPANHLFSHRHCSFRIPRSAFRIVHYALRIENCALKRPNFQTLQNILNDLYLCLNTQVLQNKYCYVY